MPTKLTSVRGEDWKAYRRVARYYEQELKRIRGATAVDAKGLRQLADRALDVKKRRLT